MKILAVLMIIASMASVVWAGFELVEPANQARWLWGILLLWNIYNVYLWTTNLSRM